MSTHAITADAPPVAGAANSKQQIRGSSVLLAGRMISLTLNFAVSVLLVRALSKSDFGAFSYALAMASLGAVVAACGLDKAVARFVPIYHERGDYPRMLGVMVLALGTILGVGIGLTFAIWGAYGALSELLGNNPLAASLLTILIVLAPLQALDRFIEKLVAAFSRPRAIFWRKHVVGPALKLAAVGSLVLAHTGVHFLAAAYLAATALGVLLYLFMLRDAFREQNLWRQLRQQPMRLPVRELCSYSVPLLSSEAVFVLRGSFAVFLLGYMHANTSVAEFRAVIPVARLNQVVFESFILMFLPVAARMFARGEHASINEMYQRTAVWIAVLTFPVFAVSFVLSKPITVLLFGAEYAESGPVLAVLALGCYVNAAMGFSAVTLKVYGKVKWIVMIDAVAALVALGLGVVLIQRFGAIGAAWSVSLTHVVHNLMNHAALGRLDGIVAFPARYLRAVATLIPITAVMLAIQLFLDPPLAAGVLCVLAGSGLALWLNRDSLDISGTFPELHRLPLVGRLCGGAAR